MTTTSVFQGIQEGAKLSSRVLKPPGGGSSISFFDDDDQTSSRSSPQPSAPSPTNIIDHEPKPNSSTPEDKVETSPVAPPSPKESNGIVVQNVSGQQDTPTLNTVNLQENALVVNGKGIESDTCDRSIVSPLQGELEELSLSNPSIANERENNSVNNGVHLNGNSVNEKDHNSDAVNGNGVHEKKEVVSHSEPKNPDIVYQSNAVTSPLFALSPSPPSMRPNADTQDRVIGHSNGDTTPQHSVHPRKIKDHMRSSIVMSDEDFTPTRSSRLNATVKDPSPQSVPAAGQRQRIPPGGFSSKLW